MDALILEHVFFLSQRVFLPGSCAHNLLDPNLSTFPGLSY